VLPRTFTHAGQARASGEQARFDALSKTLHQLLGQGVGGGFHQHGWLTFMVASSSEAVSLFGAVQIFN
jgi:hypothetical protein